MTRSMAALLLLALLLLTPQRAGATEPISIGERLTLPAGDLPEAREIWVHLPAGYAADPTAR